MVSDVSSSTSSSILFEKTCRLYVWKYFRMENCSAHCHLCNKAFVYNDGIMSNLISHLQQKHPSNSQKAKQEGSQLLQQAIELLQKLNNTAIRLVYRMLNARSRESYQHMKPIVIALYLTRSWRKCSTSWNQTTSCYPPRTWAPWPERTLTMGKPLCQHDCTLLTRLPWLQTSERRKARKHLQQRQGTSLMTSGISYLASLRQSTSPAAIQAFGFPSRSRAH